MNLTLLPNPEADSLKRENKSSPTKLLAGIIYYLIRKNFSGGCTQTLIVNHFNIKPKNVALCIGKAKESLIKMMEHTSEAYFQAAQAAEQFTQLARECSSPQIMAIMKYAARPIIQIKGAIDTSGHITKKKIDLPEKLAARVNLTLLPNPEADSLKRENKSSPTKLLAGIIYYLIRKNFGGGCTQTLIVNHFNIKPKNVALCVMGRKYLGGKDRQAATEHRSKRRRQESSSDDD